MTEENSSHEGKNKEKQMRTCVGICIILVFAGKIADGYFQKEYLAPVFMMAFIIFELIRLFIKERF